MWISRKEYKKLLKEYDELFLVAEQLGQLNSELKEAAEYYEQQYKEEISVKTQKKRLFSPHEDWA